MRYAELFAGAGGMSRGFEAAGMHCTAHAEINPHARAVLRYHYPDTPLFGDVCEVRGDDLGRPDLVSFGAPCQDLSVAGKRAGLAGSRSILFYEGVRLWTECGAMYALYENVPGAMSSNAGKDFAAVLSAFVGAAVPVRRDGWSSAGVVSGPDSVAAWRVLDLQHFGPPQRRARVFVLGARAGGVDPAEVLALSEGVCRHPSPREYAREGVTGSLAARTRGGGGLGTDFECQGGVVATALDGWNQAGSVELHHQLRTSMDAGDAVLVSQAAAQHGVVGDVVGTLDCGDATKWGRNQWAMQNKGVTSPRPRRLTPRECERLMSWPSDWTRYGVDESGKRYELSDTQRYRLCGNGVGSVVAEWIGRRLLNLEVA